ncbi:MAG: pentapeptide repeat-containing protein [Proteobacteria bacterium]|nr:pentapeptide repeat-containing protein [Pseudomonadota bacterium]
MNSFCCIKAIIIIVGLFVFSAVNAKCPTSIPANYSGQKINNFNFSACATGSLIKADFTAADLSGSTFANTDLSNADFTNSKLGPTENYPPVSFSASTLKKTIFKEADMPATNFEYAIIHCTDFSDTNLIQANFGPLQNIVQDSSCRTKFVNATLSVNLITDSTSIGGRKNWAWVDFTSANFHDMDPATVNFKNKDISNAILTDTNFTGIDFTAANLTKVMFNKSILGSSRFDQTAINGANFASSNLKNSSFICVQGYGSNGGTMNANAIKCPKSPATSAPHESVDMSNVTADNSDFTGAVMTMASFSGATLTRGVFLYADLSQANFQSQGSGTSPAQVKFGIFDYANLSQALISSVDFSGCSAIGAHFINSTLNNTNFSTARLDTADFSKTIIQETNFSQSSLKSSKFIGAQISQLNTGGAATDFSCAQMGGADLSNADIKAGLFNNAVMVAEKFCCPAKVSSGPAYCGIIDSLGIAYAQTKFPGVTGTAVKCPNNTIAYDNGSGKTPEQLCADNWRLSPNWTTTGCTASGQQTMWSINCNAKPGNIVKFADPNLKKCILANFPGQTELLITTAQQIQSVNCASRKIAKIGGLEYFKSMHTLDLSSNDLVSFVLKIDNITQSEVKLVSLDLANNKLTQLDLTSLPPIQFLNVSNNKLTGISLNANTYLHSLYAENNLITEFDISIQSNLYYVDLSHNVLTNVLGSFAKNLDQLTQLSFLDLSHNALKTIGSAKSIAANSQTDTGELTNLYLSCNPKFSCGSLDVYDGSIYLAAASSGCSVYDANQSKWVPQATPTCN